ncbi:glycerol kinase GlpK [bacterium]|nr:glycerol kinase GlpK [bacterium]
MPDPQFILALDQGTTSSRALVVDQHGAIRSVAQCEFTQHFPQPGWVEHDAEEIWNSQLKVLHQAVEQAGILSTNLSGIGITNQRETTIVWDRRTGKPIHNALVWQDRRTSATCDALKEQGYEAMIRERTGLPIDAYFSASKLAWILDQVEGARDLAKDGFLAFGTVDTWLIWKLTEGREHVTDVTNASRTMLFNIRSLDWDEELLALFNIPRSILPRIVDCSGIVAECAGSILPGSIPIAGIVGDQHAALYGQRCRHSGMAKNTYGTGAFLMLNTGSKPRDSRHNLVTTIGWKIGRDVHYALEGSVFIAGALIQWLRDGLGLIESSFEIEELASSVPDSGGVVFVPAFTGLGAPYWDQDARGAMFGLSRGTTRAHIARAALESIALQCQDVLGAMRSDAGSELGQLRVDGGATVNNLLMQVQADLVGVPLLRPQVTESTALGAAFLAGRATGVWQSEEELDGLWQEDARFEPTPEDDRLDRLKLQWAKAIERSRGWTE